jgi:hypothetical protein
MAKVVDDVKESPRWLLFTGSPFSLLLPGVVAFLLLFTIAWLGNSSLPFLKINPTLTSIATLLVYGFSALLIAICLITAVLAIILLLLRAGIALKPQKRQRSAALLAREPRPECLPATLRQPIPPAFEASYLSAPSLPLLNPTELVISPSTPGLLHIWNPRSNETFTTGQCTIPDKQPVAWSSDGCYIASLTSDGIAQVVEPATRKVLRRFGGPRQQVSALCWSPDARLLALVGSNRTISIWNPRSGEEETVSKSHPTQITMLAWSIDGKMLAAHGANRDVHVWKVEQDERLLSAARRASMLPLHASASE